jgi:hypothetical protein
MTATRVGTADSLLTIEGTEPEQVPTGCSAHSRIPQAEAQAGEPRRR